MAEGFLKSFDDELEVFSAGVKPEGRVNPNAVKVMDELGIDISGGKPQDVNEYINDSFDYVITVCDKAKEVCPVFLGDVKKQLHLGFEDPVATKGNEEEVMPVYKKIRDEIKKEFFEFYQNKLKDK